MPGGFPVRRELLVPFLPLFPVAGGRVLQVSKLHVIVSWGFRCQFFTSFRWDPVSGPNLVKGLIRICMRPISNPKPDLLRVDLSFYV